MAWRDSRGSRAHLLVSLCAVALGVAALVAIRSFGERMEQAIQSQTRILLGADLMLRSSQPFRGEVDDALNAVPGEQVRETRFFSMTVFPKQNASRLSQIRAMDGVFPFYGDFVTEPADVQHRFLEGEPTAVVEDSLMIQYGVEVGDTIRIGVQDFVIAGRLIRIAGEAPATAMFLGPRVFISADHLPGTELMRDESIARYYAYYRLPPGLSAPDLQQRRRSEWTHLRLRSETAEERKAMMGDSLVNLYRYLNLGALAALLLGGIGLAGTIQLYVRKKRDTVAVLRCLGADARSAFMVYVAQAAVVTGIGALAGALLGGGLQYLLPYLLADFLPIRVEPGWSVSSMVLSLGFGLGLSVAFATLPLLPIRHIPPLTALRPDVDRTRARWRDPLHLLVIAALALALLAFTIVHSDRWIHGVVITTALGLIFALLGLAARALMATTRRLMRDAWPFTWRQGFASLYRPNNQTTVLLVSLGLGAFLLATLSLTQDNLVNQFRGADRDNRPNMILFDVQPDQVDSVAAIVREQNLDLVETVPIVTMRLTAINGVPVGTIRDDMHRDIPHWALFREYRATYRETLGEREDVVAGEWQGRVTDPSRGIPISLEKGIADTLGVGLGGRLEFDVQGVRLLTHVRSIRNVDWRQMRTNFFVIFPAGVLESAPQYYAMVTRAPTADASARLQNAAVARHPNVSAIDLRTVVSSIDHVLDKAAFVIRYMALFSALTGLVVLGGAVTTSRYDRKAESSLLRTLGATRSQLNRIMAAEYLLLGGLASLSGILLALIASWALAKWSFKTGFTPAAWPLILIPAAVMLATLCVGILSNRSVGTGSSD